MILNNHGKPSVLLISAALADGEAYHVSKVSSEFLPKTNERKKKGMCKGKNNNNSGKKF